MTHYIKIFERFADAVADGKKPFEVRLNDRGYNAGDRVVFTVITKYETPMPHPLNDKDYEITYVHSGLGLKEGYVVFGIKEIRKGENYGSSNDD